MKFSSPHRRMIFRTFAVGLALGVSASYGYASYVEQSYLFGSVELFQTLAIFAFCAFVAPMARISVALLLAGLERGEETAAVLRDLKAGVSPMLDDAKVMISDLKRADFGRVADFLEKADKEGSVTRLAVALEGISKKIHDLAVGKMIENI